MRKKRREWLEIECGVRPNANPHPLLMTFIVMAGLLLPWAVTWAFGGAK